MRAMRYCNVKWTLSRGLDNHSLLPRLIMDALSVSNELTRKGLSSGEAEPYVLNLGCDDKSLVMNGLIDCRRSSIEIRREEK